MNTVEWRFHGACINDADPDRWFPLPLEPTAHLKAVCARCPVIAECLDWALQHETWGVWGGTTPAERVTLRGQAGIVPRNVA